VPWYDFLAEDSYRKFFQRDRFEKATEPPREERETWLTKAYERFRTGAEAVQPVERFRQVEQRLQPAAPQAPSAARAEAERSIPSASALQRALGTFRKGAELAEEAMVEPEIPIVEREKPGPREQLTREYRDIVRRLRAGEITDEEAEYLWNTAPETVFGNVSAVGLGAGPRLRDVRSFADIKALGLEAMTPLAPPEATEPLGRVPVVGRPLESAVAGLTSPLGLGFTAAWPGITAKMVAGEVAGATAGRKLAGERGEMVGGLAGALAAPIAGPAMARAAVRGVKAAPAVARTARAEVERLLPSARRVQDVLMEEAGGLKPTPESLMAKISRGEAFTPEEEMLLRQPAYRAVKTAYQEQIAKPAAPTAGAREARIKEMERAIASRRPKDTPKEVREMAEAAIEKRERLEAFERAAPVPKPAAQAFREATEVRGPTRAEALERWRARAETPPEAPEAARVGVQPVGREEALARWRTRVERAEPPREPPAGLAAIADEPPSMDLWRILEREHITGPQANNALRWLAESASESGRRIPGLTRLIRTGAGPASLARLDPARRAGVVYRLMEEVQNSQRTWRLGRFRSELPFVEAGKEGQVKIGDRVVAFADVAENPSRYPLTAAQRQWIEDGWRWIDEWTNHYERIVGKPIRAKGVEREHYWPRFAKDKEGKVYIRSRIGLKESPIKHRHFETMEEGIAEGVPYASPLDDLDLFVRSMQKMTRDELLKNVVRVDKIGRAVTPGLRQRIEEARKAVKRAKTPEQKAAATGRLNSLREARERIATPRRGEAIGLQVGPGMAGTVFERETATALKSVVGPGQRWLHPFEQVAAVPRMLVTGLLDVGHFMIQGATLLAHSSSRWAKAVGRSLQAMCSPEAYLRSLSRPAAQRAAKYAVDMAGSEFTEAARTGGLLARIPVVGPVARTVSRGFDTFLSEGRIQMFDGMAEIMAAEEGVNSLYRLGRFVNTMLGATSTRGMGISITQQQVERAFIFFSPRYTRSIFGATAYMFGKGYTAGQARLILAKMVFGGLATFYGLARLSGMSHDEAVERINPQSGGKFMSIEIGNQRVGFGTAFRSTLAFLGSLTVKDNWDFDSWGEAMLQNPFVRYLRTRAAPGTTSTLLDFIYGEDFIGYPVSLDEFSTNPRRTLEYASDKFLPLNIEAVLEAEGTQEKVIAGLAETFGGRSYPLWPYARLENKWKEKRSELPPELGEAPTSLKDADTAQRTWFYSLPDVQATRVAQIEEAAERGESWGVFGKQRLEAEEEFQQRMTKFTGTGQEFREQYEDFRREWGIRANQQYGEDFERDPRNDMEKAADDWWGVELTYKPDGSRDWDAFFEKRDAIEEANPGLKEWLRSRDVTRWSDTAMQGRVRELLDYYDIREEYYAIPYKARMPAEQQEQVREYVEVAESIASMRRLPFRRALMQTDIPDELIGLAMRYKRLPTNPARERYWRQHREEEAIFKTYSPYYEIPLGIEPEMAAAGVR